MNRVSTVVAAVFAAALGGGSALAAPDAVPTPAAKTPVTPTAAPATPAATPSDTAKKADASKKSDTDVLTHAFAVAARVDAALQKAVASVHDSSVTVWNLKKRGAMPDGKPIFRRESGGSGVVISWKGKGPFVISNEHVVQGGDRLELVTSDGVVHEARVRESVKRYDIALLEFDKAPKGAKSATFGKSDKLVEGQWVIATGNPFFLGGDGCCVATLGVISGLDRTLRGEFLYANAIQHDTEVNPGNSGGPLWNLAGELVGINGMMSSRPDAASARASNTGASFSIPIHLITGYLDALLSDKLAATAGTLGLELSDAKDKTGKPIGAKVNNVRPDSPVKTRGNTKAPTKDDVITRVWFGASTLSMKVYEVYSASDVTNALAFYCCGAKVRIRFVHDGKDMQWDGALGGGEGP